VIGRVAARFELGQAGARPAPISGGRSGTIVPAQPWVFAGWVSGQGGRLDYNATHRHDTARGDAEVRATLGRLRRPAERRDALLAALP